MREAPGRRTGPRRFLLVAGAVAVVHFSLSILSISEGMTIFRSAATPGERFWELTMEGLLFPADVLITTTGGQWAQTMAIAGNSFLWGCVISSVYHARRARSPRTQGPP